MFIIKTAETENGKITQELKEEHCSLQTNTATEAYKD
jgi:hypothetical protein